VAHRGGSKVAPENTMTAFRRAVDWWGADMLELDVRLTRDGHLVVIHDEHVDRTTDGEGPVAAKTLDEIQALDAGHRFEDLNGARPFRGVGVTIPTFEQVLTAFPDTRINAEAKEPEAAGPLVEVIRRHHAQHRVLVAAEFERCRRDARGYEGPWGASRHQVLLFLALHRLPGGGPYTPRTDVLQVPEHWKGIRIVSRAFVRAAHRRNLPVQVWTVDDPESMRRLLAWGVDGIQSDRPDILAQVLTEVAGRPPPPGPVEGAA
jgi:glycerophosphoryl diester phosphodiesterase|tara:strand:+ start:767 stop:1552 length:786 start_codon:yes stop_codon:yes gene_type:complete